MLVPKGVILYPSTIVLLFVSVTHSDHSKHAETADLAISKSHQHMNKCRQTLKFLCKVRFVRTRFHSKH